MSQHSQLARFGRLVCSVEFNPLHVLHRVIIASSPALPLIPNTHLVETSNFSGSACLPADELIQRSLAQLYHHSTHTDSVWLSLTLFVATGPVTACHSQSFAVEI